MRTGESGWAASAVCALLTAAWSSGADSRAVPDQDLDEVVVTGSRLIQSAVEATGPITILDRADLERGSPDSLGEVLQSLPLQNGSTQNLNDNDNDGSTRVNLRGLGPERTLVLLNGRRFVFGGTGADQSVDLDMIPLSMIERVEISTSGSTSIYGSDAVAGVVNVITRRNFSGLETAGSYHLSGNGDGAVRTAQALFGTESKSGNFVVGLEYLRQDGVFQSARAYSSHVESLASLNGPLVNTGSLNNPYGFFALPVPNVLDPAGLGSGWYTRTPNATGHGLDTYRVFDPGTDLYNYAPQAYLQTPTERGIVWVSGRHELGDSAEWFGEGLFHRGHTAQQYSPATYSSFNIGAAPTDPASGQQFIPASNYYNPFGTDLIGVISSLSSGSPRTFDQHIATYRAVAGLRGRLSAWHWEGSVTWAQSDADQYLTGMVLRTNVRNAVGPSGPDSAGDIVCGSPDPATGIVPKAHIIPGCVPLDLFDGPQGVTRQQLAYIERNLRDFGRNRHIVGDLSLTGPLGHMPAGDAQWAFGGQYRRESASYVPDPRGAGGITGFLTAAVPNPSVFTSRELFAELRVPLIRDVRGVEGLEVVTGARYSRYSEFGRTNSLQGGVHWRVTPHVTLRGGYSGVFRAPGLSDLFLSQVEEARPILDPCGSDPTPEQRIHCAAAGIPGGSYVQRANEPVTAIFGGNPHLRPEHGATWTTGFLLHGPEAAGWDVSLDYWHVLLRDALDSPSPFDIVDQCAATGSVACKLIERAADGSIIQIDSTEHNLTHQTQYGLDLSMGVRTEHPWGALAARLSGAWLMAVKIDSFVSGASTQLAGTRDANGISWPKVRLKGTLDWSLGPWRVSYNAQFIDSMTECGDKNLFPYLAPTDCRTISSRLYHDVFTTYELGAGLRVSVGLDNVLDTRPPFVNTSTSANTDASIYPLLGRTYVVSLGYRVR